MDIQMPSTDIGLFRQALALSSGTISYLINSTRYDAIDAARHAFCAYCLAHPEHANWVRAWHAYKESL
jgi:hypothetical protein